MGAADLQETLPPELLDGDSQAMLDLLGSLDSAPTEPAPAPKPVKENNPSRFGSTANASKKTTKVSGTRGCPGKGDCARLQGKQLPGSEIAPRHAGHKGVNFPRPH